ncbi:MAG TPA: bifunctional precorrin-2 dehydrogenase/sirohydrochlorin ferrochelatase [Candidatus Tectomicrobia bacterium]|jgi:siroheme synthase-like protein
MKVYPVFLIGLATQRCVVIGGGGEAECKVKGLLDCDAAVTVISAGVTEQLRVWAEAGAITWVPRPYQTGDLRDAYLVIATGHDPQTNTRIWQEAQAAGVLVNMTDDPAHSTFIAGSVVRQGPLTIAISTSGQAPALAVRLRQRLEQEFGPEYAAWLDLLQELRKPLAAQYPDVHERRARWYGLIDSEVIDLLREGRPDLAYQRVAEIVGGEVSGAMQHRSDAIQRSYAPGCRGSDRPCGQ